jgi:methionyl-tRNA formyltransferase
MVRVAAIGQAAFGEAVLRRLQADGVEVVGVSAPEPSGGRMDPLWSAGEEAGVPRVSTADLKTPDGLARWRELGADVCAMAFVTDFLPPEVFAAPRHGTVQYHPSLLPAHRGPSAINWAVINRETETGLTVFWPDEGLDTGPVLLQKRCEIGPDDTVGSLYFDHLYPRGVDALSEAVALVGSGEAPAVPQDHARATYEPPCGDRHAEIRWHEPAAWVYARIRGCNPQPGAWTHHEDNRLRIYDCHLTGEQAPGTPGRVLDVDDEAFTVRLNGGVLRVLRVRPDGEKKLSAGEWAQQVDLAPGFRFR